MSFSFREKELPDIPDDVNEHTAEDDESWLAPSPKSALPTNTNKSLPSIKVENMLTEEEMMRLHELWNGAGLSARAHRRKRGGNRTPRRLPAPISVPGPGDILTTSSSADPPTTSTTPSTTGTRKRSLRGFLSARPFFEKDVREKGPGALEMLRTIAQDRLKRKLRCAKSAPDLSDKAASPRRVPLQLATPPATAVPRDVESGPCQPPSSGGAAAPGAALQPEDMDENAIYFTIDSNWHTPRGSVQFKFITPLPSSPTCLGRPDSPLLHRHFSLDQLSFAAQQVTKTLNEMEFSEPVGDASDEILQLIDELSAYLEL